MKYAILSPLAVLLFVTCARAQMTAVKLWSAVYDGPGHGVDLPSAVALDAHGNFYITGRSAGELSGMDIATVKYSPSGEELLALRYNSPFNSWDEANSIAVDSSGNIYVAGTSFVTGSRTEVLLLKYSSAGTIMWQAHFQLDTVNSTTATKICLDSFGHIYVGGGLGGRMLIVKYNESGTLMDSTTFGDDSSSYNVSDIFIADSGAIYLSGSRSYLPPGADVPTVDCMVARADTECRLTWEAFLNASSPSTICANRENDLVVITQGGGTTAKYSSNGQLQWYRNSQNSNPSIMIPTGLAIDSRDGIIVSGYGCGIGCFDYMTIWYDEDGNVVHHQTYNSPDTLRDFCMAMAIDRDDNVYLTGKSASGYSDGKIVTLRYDSSANEIWEATYSSGPNATDEGLFIAVDNSGSVYVGGSSVTSNGFDYLALKYRQKEGTGIIAAPTNSVPKGYVLYQNFPNPFNPTTTIRYSLPTSAFVSLKLFGVLGNEIATLIDGLQRAGSHSIEFDATDLASGVYFYRLQAGGFNDTKKLILLK